MQPQRPIAVLVFDTEHVHIGQAHEQLAHTDRVSFHRGSPSWMA
jgi:hypothetical protein